MESHVNYRRKRALIIGINDYPSDALNYCVNDANDLRTTLESIDFLVSLVLNCNLSELYSAIETFANTSQRDDLVLLYFAGHGKQSGGDNYLLPSNYSFYAQGNEHNYIRNNAIRVQYIMDKIDEKKCCVTIYLLDCCRQMVRTRAKSASQGLLQINGSVQTFIAFACAPGKAVQDETRNNRNGSFMENLLKHITKPNRDFEEIMKEVAEGVHVQTDRFQVPFRSSSITGKVFLVQRDDQGEHFGKGEACGRDCSGIVFFILKALLQHPEDSTESSNSTDIVG